MVSDVNFGFAVNQLYCIKPACCSTCVRIVSQSKDIIGILCVNIANSFTCVRSATPITNSRDANVRQSRKCYLNPSNENVRKNQHRRNKQKDQNSEINLKFHY